MQFSRWFGDAQHHHLPQHEACALSTAELPSGRVSSRFVYLKELDARGGFVVYSNWATSRKARDLATNPHAALVFHWGPLQRQVRVEGVAERCPRAQSQVYFDTRERGSKIGAWASRQSQVLIPSSSSSTSSSKNETMQSQQQQQQKQSTRGADGGGEDKKSQQDNDDGDDGRAQLETWVAEAEQKFKHAGDDIPVPEFWGGLRIVPSRIEFWQGRQSRLHDRFVYSRPEGRDGDGPDEPWTVERLSP